MINIRDKIADIIARIIEQWIALGDFKFGEYEIKRNEIIQRLHIRDIETLVIADEVTKDQNELSRTY